MIFQFISVKPEPPFISCLTKNHLEAVLIEKKITISKYLKDKEKEKKNSNGKLHHPGKQESGKLHHPGKQESGKEVYNQAYKTNYKSNYSEYQKALNLSILKRTTLTKSKAFKSGRDDSSKCENVIKTRQWNIYS